MSWKTEKSRVYSCGRGKRSVLFLERPGHSGVHPESYQMGAGSFSPVVKWPDRKVDHSCPSIVEDKNAQSYISTTPVLVCLMLWCLSEHRDNLYLRNMLLNIEVESPLSTYMRLRVQMLACNPVVLTKVLWFSLGLPGKCWDSTAN
jgi:hypothetical protein